MNNNQPMKYRSLAEAELAYKRGEISFDELDDIHDYYNYFENGYICEDEESWGEDT